jgi:hypothetical protein
MRKASNPKASPDVDILSSSTGAPLVFISHDTRDAELAEAFSKLLRSVSAGMIKTFHSSDKKGTRAIDFGDEWYKRLMENLQLTSDVVCLFTERSLERPWILFEAGVAKGKLNTPVVGVALGVSLTRVSTGPFYQFQNMDDSEGDLTKLVGQLARRVPGLELDSDVVKLQVGAFKNTAATILKTLTVGGGKKETKEEGGDSPVAKLVEEMKALPSRVAERLAEDGEPFRRRKMRRWHPMMLDELMHLAGSPGEPIGILMAASMVRDDAPWLYELALEVYKAVKSGDREVIEVEMGRLRKFSEITMRGPFMEEFGGYNGKETHMFLMEFPRMLDHMLRRTLEQKSTGLAEPPPNTRKTPRAQLNIPRARHKEEI